jgi:hypothetical protein
MTVGALALEISASVGGSLWTGGSAPGPGVLVAADRAMYRAKRSRAGAWIAPSDAAWAVGDETVVGAHADVAGAPVDPLTSVPRRLVPRTRLCEHG